MHIHRIQSIEAYSHLIETADGLYMVDAGMTGHERVVLRTIERIGRRPEELRLLVVTHGHADHFGGVAELQKHAHFDVIVHPAHAEVVSAGRFIVSPGLNPISHAYELFARAYVPRSTMRGASNVVPIADGARLDDWGLAGRILYTTGHSAGDISVLLDDGTAFVGDAVQGRRIPGVTPPELPWMALDMDAVLDSWQRLIDEGATTLYPGHGSVITADELRPVLAAGRARRARSAAQNRS